MPFGFRRLGSTARRGSALAEPLESLDEDAAALFEDEKETPLHELAESEDPTSASSNNDGPSFKRVSSWRDGGVSSAILPGADGHVHLPPAPGPPGTHSDSSPFPGYDGHGAGGDISKCPFAALVMNADGTIYSGETAEETKARDGPKKRSSVVSMGSRASGSKGGSQGSSSMLSGAFLGAAGANLGLGKLNRDEWTDKELAFRSQMLPMLRITCEQIDGTIKPKFSQFSKHASKAENLESFGNAFYEELFDHAPEIRDELFANKSTEVLAVKLGSILHEVVRLLAIETPRELAGNIAEMGLKHIEYGLEAKHVQPFKHAMLATIKARVTERGHKWMTKNKKAWNWALDEITSLLMDAVTVGKPKVKLLNRSWLFMVERMHEESAEYSGKKNKGSSDMEDDEDDEDEEDDDADDEGAEDEDQGLIGAGGESGRSLGVLTSKFRSAAKVAGKISMMQVKAFKKSAKAASATNAAKPSAKTSHHHNDKFQTWRKKDAMVDGNPDYINGRLCIGQTFLEVFAARNSWAVQEFNFGKSPDHAEKMGLALELIVNSATKPKVLQHKLRVLALGHTQMGITSGMFPKFAEALFDFLDQVLGAYGAWDDETKESWQWMWDIVSGAFTKHLDASADLTATVEKSWDHICCHLDLNDISIKFFKALFNQMPELQKLFTKPTKMQTVMLGKALDLLVRSVSDTHVLDVELKGIAMRHIKYDINQGHLTTFGVILMQTLSDMVGPHHWDEDIEAAWLDVYMHIAEVFSHVISSGRNLISKALANNRPEDLKAALADAPRKSRSLAALEIEVDDTVVLPITWTIDEGQFAMTDVLLRDLLTLRGDRNAYYYGRRLLWEKHPRILQILVDKAPNLLPTFLDGHMWTCRYLVKGHRQVNFYIKELYGDPKLVENHNPANGSLGYLANHLAESHLGVFAHPVIVFMTDLKWNQFAKRDFLLLQLVNFLNMMFATLTGMLGNENQYLSMVMSMLQVSMCFIRSYFYGISIYKQIKSETGSHHKLLGRNFTVPFVCRDSFLWINLCTTVMSVILFAETFKADPFQWKEIVFTGHLVGREEHMSHLDAHEMAIWAQLNALTTGLVWIQLAEIFRLTHQLSALLFAMFSVMGDVLRFAMVIAVWALGLSITMYWLMVSMNLSDGKEVHNAMILDLQIAGMSESNVGDLIFYIVMSSLALTGIDAILDANWIIRGVYAVFAVTTVVVILNLLVSTMVSTYEILQRSFYELAVRSRAEIVVASEERSSLSRRQKFFDGLYFDDRLDFTEEDDGPSGGVQAHMPAETMKHPSFRVLDRIERYVGSTKGSEPWDPASMFSSATVVDDTAGLSAENSASHKKLKMLATDLTAMAGEIFNMKRDLKLDDGNRSARTDAMSEAASSAPSSVQVARQEAAMAVREDKELEEEMAKEPSKTNAEPLPKPSAASAKASSPADSAASYGKDRGATVVEDEGAAKRKITKKDLKAHSNESCLWLSVDGVVRDCTKLLNSHPGGRQTLLTNAGGDASDSFHAAHTGASFAKATAGLKKYPVVGKF